MERVSPNVPPSSILDALESLAPSPDQPIENAELLLRKAARPSDNDQLFFAFLKVGPVLRFIAWDNLSLFPLRVLSVLPESMLRSPVGLEQWHEMLDSIALRVLLRRSADGLDNVLHALRKFRCCDEQGTHHALFEVVASIVRDHPTGEPRVLPRQSADAMDNVLQALRKFRGGDEQATYQALFGVVTSILGDHPIGESDASDRSLHIATLVTAKVFPGHSIDRAARTLRLALDPQPYSWMVVVPRARAWIPALPVRLDLVSTSRCPFENQPLFAHKSAHARRIYEYGGGGHFPLADTSTLEAFEIDELEGDSGDLAQLALHVFDLLPGSSCWIGRVVFHGANNVTLEPVVAKDLMDKLRGLREAGGFSKVFLAHGQKVEDPKTGKLRTLVNDEFISEVGLFAHVAESQNPSIAMHAFAASTGMTLRKTFTASHPPPSQPRRRAVPIPRGPRLVDMSGALFGLAEKFILALLVFIMPPLLVALTADKLFQEETADMVVRVSFLAWLPVSFFAGHKLHNLSLLTLFKRCLSSVIVRIGVHCDDGPFAETIQPWGIVFGIPRNTDKWPIATLPIHIDNTSRRRLKNVRVRLEYPADRCHLSYPEISDAFARDWRFPSCYKFNILADNGLMEFEIESVDARGTFGGAFSLYLPVVFKSDAFSEDVGSLVLNERGVGKIVSKATRGQRWTLSVLVDGRLEVSRDFFVSAVYSDKNDELVELQGEAAIRFFELEGVEVTTLRHDVMFAGRFPMFPWETIRRRVFAFQLDRGGLRGISDLSPPTDWKGVYNSFDLSPIRILRQDEKGRLLNKE